MGSFTVIKPRSTKELKSSGTGGTFTDLNTGEVITKDPVPAAKTAGTSGPGQSQAPAKPSVGGGLSAAPLSKKQSTGTVNKQPATWTTTGAGVRNAAPRSASTAELQYRQAQAEAQKNTPPAARSTVKRPTGAPSLHVSGSYAQLQNQARQAAMDLDTEALNRANAALKQRRAAAGRQTLGDRVSDVLSAVTSGSGAAYTNLAGFVYNAYNDPEYMRNQARQLQKALDTGRTSDGKPINAAQRRTIQAAISRLNADAARMEAPDSLTNRVYGAADRMQGDSAQFQTQAKRGLGGLGSMLVDAGVSMGQSTLDNALGALTGTGLAPFALRAFGGSAQEARQGGASIDQQLAYGSAQAAKEYVTEKLFGLTGPQRLAGGGSFDDAIEAGIRNVTDRLASTPAGQKVLGGVLTWLASGATEGAEEAIGSVIENTLINPNLRAWAPDDRTAQEKFEEGLYETLVGAVSGLMGGVQNLAGYQVNPMTARTGPEGGPGETETGPGEGPGPSGGTDTTPGANDVTEASEAQQRQEVGNQLLDLMRQVQRQREAEQQRAAQTDPLMEAARRGGRLTDAYSETETRERLQSDYPALERLLFGQEAESGQQEAAPAAETAEGSQAFVNPDAPGDDGLGAADAGTVNTDYDRLQAQSREFFPEGPNPARPVDVPRTDFEGRPISQTASTVMGAKAIPDNMIPMIEQMISSGQMSYEKVSNKAAANRARARIEEIGFQGALAEFREAVRVGKTSKNMQVLGQALINNAANAGDGNALAELLTLYQITGTNTAQAEQARTLFRQLSPESQLYGIQKSVSELNRTLERRQGPDRLNQDDAGTVIEALEEARQEALRQLETMTAAYENVVDAMREGYQQADAEESESPGWVEQLARDLAKSAGRRAGGGRTASASIYRTLLGDLNAFMSEHVAAQRNSSQKRTAADKIADLFANREEYARAWESAKERLREAYKDSPAALEALEDFLQASIGYNGVGPDTTMLRAVTEAALENDVTIKDAVIRGQYDRAALVNQIADTLIQRTGAKGSDQTVVRNAVERWVQNRIEDSGKTAGDYIRQDVNKAVGEIGLKMSEIIRSSPGSQEAAARQIADLLTERYGLSEEGARRVAEAATADFRFSVEETSRRALDQMFKERPRRARKELSKRMEELINLGAFSSEYSDAAVKRVLGVENIQINQELLQKFLDQTDQEGRNAVMEEILQDAADQMPGSWRGIFDEARYLSMLFNPKTHWRNVIFNAAFQPFVMAKNRIGAVGELAAQAAGVNLERTKSVIPADPFGQLAMEARADWKEFQDFLDNSHYSDSTGKSQIAKRASPYKNVKHFQELATFLEKTMGRGSKLNMKALSVEDGWFKTFIYSQSLAGYLQANGVKSISEADPELLSRARNYAAQEALRNTFNDRNSLSDAVASLARLRNSDNKYLRGFSYFTEGALPFKRTPVNIGVRAYEYSVGGIADLAELIYEGSTGRATSESITKHIDRIAANVSGASLLVLGFMAAGAGYLRGGDDEDDRQRAFDDLVGHQSYSLEFPNGTSVTLGQAAPASIPLFMGVELEQALEDGTISPEEAASLLKNLSEPMLQMSVLQSVNDLFETAALAKQRDKNVAASLAVQALTNYFTQAIPTMGGQIERTGEDQRMSTYVDKNSLMPVDLQKILGKTSQKIPGWDYHQIPYIDLWGREEETGGPAERAYNNFLNPFYMSEVRIGQVEEELQRLKDATGDSTVLPNWVGKSITVGKETKQLTADEYVQYARTTGQTRRQVLEQLMDSAGYRKLSDEGKAKAVQAVYEYADGVGKMAVSSWKPSSSHILSGIQKSMLPPAEYILYKQFSDRDGSGSTSQAESSQTLMEMDLTNEQRGQAWSAMNNKGETEEARARKEAKNPFTGAMAQEGFDPEEALKFWQIYDGTGTKEDPYTKQEKQTDIMEALGLSSRMEAISLWNLMEKSVE